MPVYAPQGAFASRRSHPRLLLVIVAGHAALLAAVMSAKMDLPSKVVPTITRITLIDPPKPPPPDQPPPPRQPTQPRDSVIDRMPVIVPTPQPDIPNLDSDPVSLPPTPADIIGNKLDPLPPRLLPPAEPVRVGPRFATPADLVKPPYPDDKRRLDEEAVLRLRLSIDERGRVVAVEPVGRADRSFLEAARRHIIAHWRYRPASEDGRAVASSTVITLRFEIE